MSLLLQGPRECVGRQLECSLETLEICVNDKRIYEAQNNQERQLVSHKVQIQWKLPSCCKVLTKLVQQNAPCGCNNKCIQDIKGNYDIYLSFLSGNIFLFKSCISHGVTFFLAIERKRASSNSTDCLTNNCDETRTYFFNILTTKDIANTPFESRM